MPRSPEAPLITDTRALVDRALAAATDTRLLVLEAGALASVAKAFRHLFEDRAAVVVADLTTWDVAGRRAEAALLQGGIAVHPPIVLPVPLHADLDRVLEVEAALAADDAIPIAVGSGTINDLTKLAAARLGRPYMVVATAASMDGYAAFGAYSMRIDSFLAAFLGALILPGIAILIARLTFGKRL